MKKPQQEQQLTHNEINAGDPHPQQVERRGIAVLVPYARNARKHSAQQIAQIAASIKEWGWTLPILIDEADNIVAGHGRVAAARKLGMTNVPVIVARGWSESKKRAYILADNKLAANAEWDNEILRLELHDLQELGVDAALVGFSADDLKELLLDDADQEVTDKEIVDQEKQLLLIETDSERELQKLFDEMQERGFKCKVMN